MEASPWILQHIATMTWHDARPHVSWDFAEDGAGALFCWPTGAFKLVLLRQRCARQRRVYILHVIVKVMTAETRFLPDWHAIGWGPAISVFTGGTSSCLAAAQLFSPNVVDHARLKKICGRTGIGAHTSANCFWQLAPGSGWRFATAAVPRRQKDAKGFLKCDATLSVGKSWVSSPLIAIAFGGTGELCIPGGPTPVSPADVLRCFYGQPCWALFIHIGLASSFRHSPQHYLSLCRLYLFLFLMFSYLYNYLYLTFSIYMSYIHMYSIYGIYESKKTWKTWSARSMLPLPNHGCFHGWTVTIAEAQGDKSGSDEAWEHWMERRKCGHLQTQNSDVLKELWKRRRSKGKLWFTSGFEGTLMDIKCY